jgi:hypothetical protein
MEFAQKLIPQTPPEPPPPPPTLQLQHQRRVSLQVKNCQLCFVEFLFSGSILHLMMEFAQKTLQLQQRRVSLQVKIGLLGEFCRMGKFNTLREFRRIG